MLHIIRLDDYVSAFRIVILYLVIFQCTILANRDLVSVVYACGCLMLTTGTRAVGPSLVFSPSFSSCPGPSTDPGLVRYLVNFHVTVFT